MCLNFELLKTKQQLILSLNSQYLNKIVSLEQNQCK